MTIQRPACDARHLLLIVDGLTILHHGDHSSSEGDVVGLSFVWLTRLFQRGSQEAVHASCAHSQPFWLGIIFDLEFVPTAQVDAAIRS